LLDRIYSEGMGRGTLQTAAEIAMLSRTDTWQVLRVAAQRWMRPATRLPVPKTNRFVTRAARESLPWPADNPWLEAPADALPGKRRHVWALIGIQNHLEGYGRESFAPYVSPLMSQPLLETCLTIPSWLWCTGGNNRAIVREAFRNRLPPEIIDRRTKGAFDSFVAKLIEKNRRVLREMLLDGLLVREGIIDPLAVSAFLDSTLPARDGLGEFAALADVEAWVSGRQNDSGCGVCR
jgi:asparagine synthase (glutamine-hydrolysing)